MRPPAFSAAALLALALFAVLPAEGAHPDSEKGPEPEISRILLGWNDGSEAILVERGSALQAIVDVTIEGSGIISGEWEIALPKDGKEAPAFEKLLFINKYISESGLERFISPPLPTELLGSHTLRVTITSPRIDNNHRYIHYFVGERSATDEEGETGAIPPAVATSGPSETKATGETRFSWEPIPGSIAYQVELYDKIPERERGKIFREGENPGVCMLPIPSELKRPPVVGIMVPAEETDTTLDELTSVRLLAAGKPYLWRVLALGSGGKVLCESPFKEFFLTE